VINDDAFLWAPIRRADLADNVAINSFCLLVLIKASRYPGCSDTRQLVLQGRLARIDQVFPRKLLIPYDRVCSSIQFAKDDVYQVVKLSAYRFLEENSNRDDI